MSNELGSLYVVATPIGNLGDITRRACEVLSNVDLIVAEDKRHSLRLLNHLGIGKPMLTLHEHNERQVVPNVIARLRAGNSVALVSDAGTPLISDPGFELVKALRECSFNIVSVPGPCALVAALSVSGLPTNKFIFEGFLPAARGARKAALEAVATEPRTLVFYEAPHRITESLACALDVFGGTRRAVLARELTKTFETVLSGTLAELTQVLEADENQRKGEFVFMVAGCEVQDSGWEKACATLEVLLRELPLKRAVAVTATLTGAQKNRLYKTALGMTASDP